MLLLRSVTILKPLWYDLTFVHEAIIHTIFQRRRSVTAAPSGVQSWNYFCKPVCNKFQICLSNILLVSKISLLSLAVSLLCHFKVGEHFLKHSIFYVSFILRESMSGVCTGYLRNLAKLYQGLLNTFQAKSLKILILAFFISKFKELP